jgi:hypothetical protein
MENHKAYQKMNEAYHDLPKMLEETLKNVYNKLK